MAIAKRTPAERIAAFARRLGPLTTDVPLVRLGTDGDGGYLVPDDLDGIVACFSPGVDNRATFESELMDRGIRCHLADATVTESPLQSPLCTFRQQHVGVANTARFITMDRWIAETKVPEGDLLLQMDIEGAEWTVLLNISEHSLRRFRIVVLELHDMERLMDEHAFSIVDSVFDRLLEDFYVVHNHPNNYGGLVRAGSIEIPRCMEMTLLRRDRAFTIRPAAEFPHPLDRANTLDRPDIALPAAWRA